MGNSKFKTSVSLNAFFNRSAMVSRIFTEVHRLIVGVIFSVFSGNISVNLGAMRVAPFLASLLLSEENQ